MRIALRFPINRIVRVLLALTLAVGGWPVPVEEGRAAVAFRSMLSGYVKESLAGVPVPNVTLRLVGTMRTATTNAAGYFVFPYPPLGRQTLLLDARTTPLPGQWPIFAMAVDIVDGWNGFPTPIWIPELDEGNGVTLTASNYNPTTGQTLQSIVVTSPAAPGAQITIPSGIYMQNVWGALQLGQVLSLTNVPPTKPPQPLPNGAIPGMLVMIQPGGIKFFSNAAMTTPAKVPVQFPNVLNEFPAGSKVSLYSTFGGSFGTAVNGGSMTTQGSTILPDAGTGLAHFACAWTPPNPPVTTTHTDNNPEDLVDPTMASELSIGSEADPLMGRLTVGHPVAGHRAMGESEQLRLVYTSTTAHPHPVLTSHTGGLPASSPSPTALSVGLTVNGTSQGSPVFWQGVSQLARQAVTFDATALATGRYPYALNVVNQYQASSIGTSADRTVLVHNQIPSPFGAGWGLADLHRLQLDPAGNALVIEGSGKSAFFELSSGGPIEDLVVSHLATNNICLILGNGDGTFQPPVTSSVGNYPNGVAIGHFNQDAFTDLAVANFYSNNVSILLGNGNGTFQPQLVFPVGNAPAGVVIGHFNGDAFEDLAVARGSNPAATMGFVSILLGNGNGTFQPHVTFSVGVGPYSIAVGHLNGDAFQDLVTANAFSDDVSILLGNGNGTFQSQAAIVVGGMANFAQGVTIGDFNHDTFKDLAVARYQANAVSILLGNGDGTFQSPQTISSGNYPTALATGHFNGDAFQDLVVANYVAYTFSILLGNGDGTFQSPLAFQAPGWVPTYLVIGHFNNQDIFEDVAVEQDIFLGNGDGTFQSPQAAFQQTGWLGGMAVGNFNNDSTTPGFTSPPGDFSTLVKNGNGTFTWRMKDGTRYEFDAQGRHTQTKDRNNNTTTYAYNPNGTLSTITDPTGFVYTFGYTGGKLNAITDSAGRTTVVTVNAAGDLVEIIDPDGARSTFAYNSSQVTGTDHLMATRTTPRAYDPSDPLPPSSFVTTYTYNFAGQLIQTNRPAPGGQTITWNLLPSQANALVNPASGQGTSSNPAPTILAQNVAATLAQPEGQVTTMTTDKFGSVNKATDSLGRITTIKRDNHGNPAKITKPNGAVTKMSYDLKGNLLTMTEEGTNGPGSDDQATIFTYEPTYNQVTTMKDPNNNINPITGVTTKIDYDSNGNPTLITDVYDTKTELHYDQPGLGHPTVTGLLTTRIEAKNLPEQATTIFDHEPTRANLQDITDPMGRITSFTYFSSGQTHTTKAEGNDSNPATDQLTTFTYDAMNRLTTVLDAENGLTQHTYDKNGNLTVVTDAKTPAGSWTFAYDEVDRLSKATDPVLAFETFAYDKDSKLKTLTDRKNQIFTFTYDPVFRLTQKEFPGAPATTGNTIVTFSYDANHNTNLLDDNDNLGTVTDPDAIITNTYDGFDRLATVSTANSLHQPDVTLAYTYDKNGNRLTLIATQGTATVALLSYTPDSLNRLDLLTNVLTSQAVDFVYDVLSRRKRVDLPNNTRTTTTYNAAGDILTRTHVFDPTSANTLLSSFTYVLDPVGNRDTLTETRPSFSITNGLNDFGYDKLNRLLSATHPTIPGETYAYDPVGNRDPSTWIYNTANRLTTDGTYNYTYDANGNLLTKTELAMPSNVTTYTYDPENWLASVVSSSSTVNYKYDGLDRRIQKDVNGAKTRYIYDHDDLFLEYDGTNVLKARWLQGAGVDDPLLLERDVNSNQTFEPTERFVYHADGLGSITELTNSLGAVTRSYLYDAFGQLANQTGTLLNPYTYTSREYDPETGLMHYRARAYDQRTGRFLQEDPQSYTEEILANSEGAMLTQPALGHAYIYALDNPVNLTDPDGRSPIFWAVARTAVQRVATRFVTRAAPIIRQAAARAWQRTRAIAHEAFRPGGWVNRGPHFRIGFGQDKGRRVFRAAGNIVKRVTGRSHIDFWKGPRL